MKLSSFLGFLVGLLYWASPFIAEVPIGPETTVATTVGAIIASLALLSAFSGSTGARQINQLIGLVLAVSSLGLAVLTDWNATALAIQGVAGLLTLGISLLQTRTRGETGGGWKRVTVRATDDSMAWN